MTQNDEPPVILEADGVCTCTASGGVPLEVTPGKARLYEESFAFLPPFGPPFLVPLRDIVQISAEDYRIQLSLTAGSQLTLSSLGYRYEDFFRVLVHLRNEVLLKELLMHETVRKSGVEASFERYDRDGSLQRLGDGELRLYESGVVLLPQAGEPTRIPYGYLSAVLEEDYSLVLLTDFGERYRIGSLGSQRDAVARILSEILNEIGLRTQESLRHLVPDADPLTLRGAARLMKEGRAARRRDIEAVSPTLWTQLEARLQAVGIKEEYDFLQRFGAQELCCIGIKRGLLGGLTGEYLWFLIPLFNADPREPGNALAMEAASTTGPSGRATYFFRIVPRSEYPRLAGTPEMEKRSEQAIADLNLGLSAINFRREPIYLSEERLLEPRYRKYRSALERVPELRRMRRAFIGRVFHVSRERWEADVLDLLSFHVRSLDDEETWQRDMGREEELTDGREESQEIGLP